MPNSLNGDDSCCAVQTGLLTKLGKLLRQSQTTLDPESAPQQTFPKIGVESIYAETGVHEGHFQPILETSRPLGFRPRSTMLEKVQLKTKLYLGL